VQANVGVSDKGAREGWFTPRSRKVLLSTTALAPAAAAAPICFARRKGGESAAPRVRPRTRVCQRQWTSTWSASDELSSGNQTTGHGPGKSPFALFCSLLRIARSARLGQPQPSSQPSSLTLWRQISARQALAPPTPARRRKKNCTWTSTGRRTCSCEAALTNPAGPCRCCRSRPSARTRLTPLAPHLPYTKPLSADFSVPSPCTAPASHEPRVPHEASLVSP
jgi:hypothetical protein